MRLLKLAAWTGLVVWCVGTLVSCASALSSPSDLQDHLNQTVTVEGVAKITRLGGPTVDFDNGGFVMVGELPPQFESYVGRRVQVTGKLVEAPDPLSTGSRWGSSGGRQYLIQDARWKLLDTGESQRIVRPTGSGY
jgi:hypothetical protein